MAEEEVVAAGSSPVPSDHKRKFEDLEPEAPQPTEPSSENHLELNANSNLDANDGEKADVVVSDEGENKRPRIDEKLDGLGTVNIRKTVYVFSAVQASECCFGSRR